MTQYTEFTMMQTKPQHLDLKKLTQDKHTQKQFCDGLVEKSTTTTILTKEFSASGVKTKISLTD